MKHTECEDCELREGDCGYHFKMDGKTNYDIASLSACDKYGNCMFFKAKAKPQGDLISREALKKALKNQNECENCTDIDCINCFYDIIDNAPSVELTKPQSYAMGFCDGLKAQTYEKSPMFERPQGEWKRQGYEPYGVCSICGELCEINNFCGNCGADMRKGGAENEN